MPDARWHCTGSAGVNMLLAASPAAGALIGFSRPDQLNDVAARAENMAKKAWPELHEEPGL